VGDDAAAIRRYLTLFDTTSRGLLDRIAGAIERRDSVDLSRAAHTLKGTAGNVGAAEVSGLARELEAAAGRADWASCGGLGAELRVALDRAAAFARTVAG
jgi:HPt (histidine-containing phosphotransfer) domain-containing protein